MNSKIELLNHDVETEQFLVEALKILREIKDNKGEKIYAKT